MDFMRLNRELKQLSNEKKQLLIKQFFQLIGYNETNHLREVKYSNGIVCPLCGSGENIVGHGKTKPGTERQRYRCKNCTNRKGNKGYTFNDYTSGILHRSRSPEKLKLFLEFMLQGLSVREIADRLNISKTTAQAWRHKVLDAVMKLAPGLLSGIVEVQEVPVIPSRKGMPRQVNTANNSSSPDTLIVAKDRKYDIFLGTKEQFYELIKKSHLSQNEITWLTDGKVSINLEDTKKSSLSPLSNRLIGHTRNVSILVEKFYYMQSVRMRGVATRNLPKYAAWQRYLIITEALQPIFRVRDLLKACL